MSKREWIRLALRAVRGIRTYDPPVYSGEPCDCPECTDPNYRIPWRYRFNQPPFVREEIDPMDTATAEEFWTVSDFSFKG